jgi:hypothetical protein
MRRASPSLLADEARQILGRRLGQREPLLELLVEGILALRGVRKLPQHALDLE